MLERHSPWLTTCWGMDVLNRSRRRTSIAPKRPRRHNRLKNMPWKLIAILLMLCGPVMAAEINVSSAADIAAALEKAKTGDTLVMAVGTWSDQAIVFKASGAEQNPITLRAQSPGKVVLSGKSSLKIDGEHLVVSGLFFKD